MARAWVDGDIAAQCGDHGSIPMQLRRWHLAEEFEHRTAAAYLHEVNRIGLGEAELAASQQREQDAWLAVGMLITQ